ncbi:MAG TPA: serine/threonine-protein kinase, partial [Kofleriaceae bacterium]|nr:serine/threonine-protein kinase [Kofleriaceae bacterium]
MAPERATRLVPWSPTATSEEMRAYLQERLALLSKLSFWIFWILVFFVHGLYEIYPELRPARVDIVDLFSVSGLVVLGLIWQFALRKRRSSWRALYAIDALYALLIGTAFGMSAYFSADKRAAVWSAFIWHTFIVFSRVIVVPSSGRRTAAVTALSYLPLLLAAAGMALWTPHTLELPPIAFVVGGALFIAIATLLATTGSRVIYGLRRQVSEAMQLGQYTLDEKIGEGGMGAVYRARHALLRRPTAVKLLPAGRYGADNIKRFEREVQHMSRLTHPNTVAVFDYGRSPAGVFYYAMEYLDGIDLETLVRRDGPQRAPRVIHILRQVCGALDEAHAMGLSHRDIKPANIILCRRGRMPDVAKVVDFGLVKEITRTGDGDSATKVIMGTPAYLAPEAVTDPDRVGPASDLYALGCVGYFLLTATRVFEGKTAVDICVKHVSHAPEPPSRRTDNPIPAELEALVLACLAKDPAERPKSAFELRAALGRLPAYVDWDEAEALSWWNAFEARRASEPAPTERRAGPLTITVDVHARTATS